MLTSSAVHNGVMACKLAACLAGTQATDQLAETANPCQLCLLALDSGSLHRQLGNCNTPTSESEKAVKVIETLQATSYGKDTDDPPAEMVWVADGDSLAALAAVVSALRDDNNDSLAVFGTRTLSIRIENVS